MNKILLTCSLALLISQPLMAAPDKDKPLPPGLAKKVAQGKPLPPGWQKKLAPGQFLPDDYYRRGVVLGRPNSDGIISIQIEGTVVELFEHSREIVRILEGRH
ncbi:MAG TPA: hypothetical protein VIN66_12505 [Rheinheimera sp.]|jgi:hypothetical protein|uniref:hypothetical protein n=1 Tax=Rheinheimera sp. TaxID=1869214 RepID=UPI002F91F571